MSRYLSFASYFLIVVSDRSLVSCSYLVFIVIDDDSDTGAFLRSSSAWCRSGITVVNVPQDLEQVGEICFADVTHIFTWNLSLLWLEELANLALALRLERINAHILALTASDDSDENCEVVLLEEALHRVEGRDSANIGDSVILAVFLVDVATVEQQVISDAHAFAVDVTINKILVMKMVVVTVDGSLVIGRENGVSPDLAAGSTVIRRSLGLFTS